MSTHHGTSSRANAGASGTSGGTSGGASGASGASSTIQFRKILPANTCTLQQLYSKWRQTAEHRESKTESTDQNTLVGGKGEGSSSNNSGRRLTVPVFDLYELVGIVVGVATDGSGYLIEDGTGGAGEEKDSDPGSVIQINRHDTATTDTLPVVDQYVRVLARFLPQQSTVGQLHLSEQHLRPVTDYNEITSHALSIIAHHLRQTRAPRITTHLNRNPAPAPPTEARPQTLRRSNAKSFDEVIGIGA